MSRIDIVRAWKNPAYRQHLPPEETALLPAHPSGLVELTDSELKQASGVLGAVPNTTAQNCTEFTLIKHRCCP
jgi:mersacidin/lichenicidin family type 2 lantibiotic